jgi:hypothetical protein
LIITLDPEEPKILKLALINDVKFIEIVAKANKKMYKLQGKIELKNEEINKKRQEAGRFILATNILDEQKIKPQARNTRRI